MTMLRPDIKEAATHRQVAWSVSRETGVKVESATLNNTCTKLVNLK